MNCKLYNEILSRQDPEQAVNLSRFFKTGKGQYGEGDKFLGIKVPVTREVVKQCWKETTFDDLETCISSEYHEIRLAALLTLVQIFKQAKKDKASQKRCVDFYLAHTEFTNCLARGCWIRTEPCFTTSPATAKPFGSNVSGW